MSLVNLHPAIIGFLGVIMLIIFYGKDKPFKLIIAVCPLIMAYLSITLIDSGDINILGHIFIPIKIKLASKLFACVFSIALMTGGIYAYIFKNYLEVILAFIYASSALVVTFAGDWLLFFLALESMVIASAMIIFFGEKDENKIYARRYFLIHIFAGVMLLSGFILVSDSLDAREIIVLTDYLSEVNKTGFGSILILSGLLINVGMPPFADWVNDCYAAASPPGNVILNTYTTKVSVFLLLSVFQGLEILIYLGIIMQLYGIIYAVLEDKFRKALNSATTMVIGIMLVGVGLGGEKVLLGTSILACSHIFYKQLLIMIAGLVEKNHFTDRFSKLYKLVMKPGPLVASSIIAYLGLISFPGSASFLGKSIITESLARFNHTLYEILLLISSLIFFIIPMHKISCLESSDKDNQSYKLDNSRGENATLMLLFMANLLFSLALYPLIKFDFLSENVNLQPMASWKQVSGQLSLLAAGLLLFMIFRGHKIKTNHDLISTNYCYGIFRLPVQDLSGLKNKKLQNITEKLKFVANKLHQTVANMNNLDIAGQLIIFIIILNLIIVLF
jgi:multicomponent Na+:H+ antiporter subunit D